MRNFKPTWDEVLDAVRRKVLDAQMSKEIMRASGFRPFGSFAGGGGGQGPILGLPPVTDGQCPRPPYGSTTALMGDDRDEWIAAIRAAANGETWAYEVVRDLLVAHGLETSIVMGYIMDMCRYDWDGTPATITFDSDGPCPIEIDVTPPEEGLWEQLKEGDTRFSTADYVLPRTGQDYRALVKSVTLFTASALSNVQNFNANAVFGLSYPTCIFNGQTGTHPTRTVFTIARTGSASVYQKNYGASSPTFIDVYVTNQAMQDFREFPFMPETRQRLGNIDQPGFQFQRSTNSTPAGLTTFPGRVSPNGYFIDANIVRCADYDISLFGVNSFNHDHWIAIGPNGWEAADSRDTGTPPANYDYRYSDRIWKHPAGSPGHQTIDWTVNPSGGATTVQRFNQTLPTFDVVGVRFLNDREPIAIGEYWHPYDLEHYATEVEMAGVSETITAATALIDMPGAELQAVWAESKELLVSGERQDYGDSVSLATEGQHTSGWAPIPDEARAAESVWVGVVLRVDEELELLVTGNVDVLNR